MSVTEDRATTYRAHASPKEFDEAAVIEDARHDPAAFAPLYERFSTPIYRYCYRQVRDADLAADLTAQVFIQALEKLHRYQPKPGATFRSWLFAIARNATRDRWRRHRPMRDLDDAIHAVADSGPGPEQIAVHRSEMARLLDALDALPGRQRDIVGMRLEGLSMREIADAIGVTENAVKTAQTRAFRTLRTLLGEEDER